MRLILTLSLAALTFGASASEELLDCSNPTTTIEINQCAANELKLAQQELSRYLSAAIEHNQFDNDLVAAINVAQEDWIRYYNSHCESVFTMWRHGTIRGVMESACRTQLTRRRTHDIWFDFLTSMDNAAPELPEPAL